jgi:hypothetical protein
MAFVAFYNEFKIAPLVLIVCKLDKGVCTLRGERLDAAAIGNGQIGITHDILSLAVSAGEINAHVNLWLGLHVIGCGKFDSLIRS